MTIPRRTFLAQGASLTAVLAGEAGLFRLPGCRAGALTRAATSRSPSSEGLCVGRVTGRGRAQPPRPPLHPDTLARFVDPLPIPRVLEPSGTRPDPERRGIEVPSYRVAMRDAEVRVHRDLPPTRMWGYEGEVPGPTIVARSGQPLWIEWVSELPERHFLPIDHTIHGAHEGQPEVRTVVHVHGAKVPPESDGYPESWFLPGASAASFYPTRQDAATLWYHDHTMGIERLNQYAGLFGFFLVRDATEDALGLPSGPHEIPLVLCDRLFDAKGQLIYPTSGLPDAPWVPEVNGDAHLVNGKLAPYVEVEPRPYRLRILNASNSRFYYLSLSGDRAFHQIGTDQGLLASPVSRRSIMLAPGERVDVIVDFGQAAGERVLLQSQTLELLQFRVAPGPRGRPPDLPKALRSVPRLERAEAVRTRTLTLREHVDAKTGGMRMLLDGASWTQPVTERPLLDSVEIWELVNLTEDSHPIHLHLVRFQLLDRQGYDFTQYDRSRRIAVRGPPRLPAPEDGGWKDTIRAEPWMITRIIARFEGFPGRYVWHCHVLEHAANEMMRPFEIVAG
jgi:spore coat protein A, manganese oxidase